MQSWLFLYCNFEVLESYCHTEWARLAQKSTVLTSISCCLCDSSPSSRGSPCPLEIPQWPSQKSKHLSSQSPAGHFHWLSCMEEDICGANANCLVWLGPWAEMAKHFQRLDPSSRNSCQSTSDPFPQPDHQTLAEEIKGIKGPPAT